MFIVSKCYEVVTFESSLNGDADRRGFVYENRVMDMEDIVREIRDSGCTEPSDSYRIKDENPCYAWLFSDGPVCDRDHIEKGEDKFFSLHFAGITNRQFYDICKAAGIRGFA